jgi:hypothetical protein
MSWLTKITEGSKGREEMKTRAQRLVVLAGAALLYFGIPAFGEDVTIDFTGVVNSNVQVLGAYAGYYSGTVNGVSSQPGFICDDYNNEIFLPSESWQATATTFSSLVTAGGQPTAALSTTLFGNNIGLPGYAAIAYLSNLMSTTPASGQGDIAAAIWYIGSLNSSDPVPLSSLDATAQGYVTLLLGSSTQKGLYDGTDGPSKTPTAAAIAELQGSNLWIYTPTGQDITPVGDPFPQEFIGNVSEGGGPFAYLLLASMACFGAIRFKSRSEVRNRKTT